VIDRRWGVERDFESTMLTARSDVSARSAREKTTLKFIEEDSYDLLNHYLRAKGSQIASLQQAFLPVYDHHPSPSTRYASKKNKNSTIIVSISCT